MSAAPITPTRLVRIRELFDNALELETGQRASYLVGACGSDDTLRSEVDSLLAALERGGDTWNLPLGGVLASALLDADEEGVVGRRVGPYHVKRLIGFGGMGAVYEGTRVDDHFQKCVALKFLRRGMEGDLAIRRFRYERQILADLNHKNIAALLDGGVTADGQPYFVMEYVDGIPITTYCTEQRLTVRDRVQLLRQICAAVQHAHQHLVVHRDLKPGNILVTPDGTVKLLDFGIAKLLREAEGPDQLPMTQGGARAFTPDYASPEQVRGLPVATASDVYALGVIASELLSGHRPFSLAGRLFSEWQETISRTPAPAPSSLVTEADAPPFGERSASRLRAHLKGDLDAIVLQALRKEPERRYGSAEQLGQDLRRYLNGLPVSAQRDRMGYRFGKFVKRRRIEVAAGVLVAVSLVGGIAATTRQARRAELERAKTDQVNNFLTTMLSAVDPGYQGRDVTVAMVLRQAAKGIETQKLDPEVEAEIRHSIGQTYYGLGLYDLAEAQAQRAYDLRLKVYGRDNLKTATSLSYVVALLEARGEFAKAEILAREAVRMTERAPDADAGNRGNMLDNLARLVQSQGRLDEAYTIQKEAIAWRRQATDSVGRASLVYGLNNLAVSLTYQGKLAAAESLYRESIPLEAELHSRQTPNYGESLLGLAAVLADLNRFAEADSLYREALPLMERTLGESHANYLRGVNAFARFRNSQGDAATAAQQARKVVAHIGGSMPEGDNTASYALQTLGIALDSLGQYAGADSALRRSLALRKKYLPEGHWAIASSESVLGWHLVLMQRVGEAEPMLLSAYTRLAAARGATALPALDAAKRLAAMYERTKRPAQAAEWRKRATS